MNHGAAAAGSGFRAGFGGHMFRVLSGTPACLAAVRHSSGCLLRKQALPQTENARSQKLAWKWRHTLEQLKVPAHESVYSMGH